MPTYLLVLIIILAVAVFLVVAFFAMTFFLFKVTIGRKSFIGNIVNKKFNSVYKFLITKFPDKEYRYSKLNEDYRAQIKFEKFREKYFYLYAEYIED